MKELNLDIFPKVDQAKWTQLAQNQLKGEDPFDKLNWESHGISELKPYYDSTDSDSFNYLNEFFTTLSSHRWKLYQSIKVGDEKASNQDALAALMGGCDGLIFDLDDKKDLKRLLHNVDLAICDVSIMSQGYELELPSGVTMTQTPSSKNAVGSFTNFQSPIAQLSHILSQISNEKYIIRKSFSDFFLEIATVRALRFLVEKVKGLNGTHIHTSVSSHESEEHQWFLNTTAGLASILGGSHSIDMPTQLGDERITRNVGNLIRDESQINEYTDQCGGSYFVDSLTDKIIQEVKNELGL